MKVNWRKFIALIILYGLLAAKVDLGLETWQRVLLGVAIGLLSSEK